MISTISMMIIIALLVACNCGLLGCFLILRGEAMFGDAISHAILPGIVLSFILSGSMNLLGFISGAILAGILAIIMIRILHSELCVAIDAAMGIVFTSFFSIGILLIANYSSKIDLDLGCVLYGNLVIAPSDLLYWGEKMIGPKSFFTLALLLIANIIFVAVNYPTLVLTSFDPSLASSIGVNTRRWYYLLLIATTITIVLSFNVVGAILVVGFLVVPPATAYLLAHSLLAMLGYILLCDLIITSWGYLLASSLNSSLPGAMMSIAGVLLLLTLFMKKKKGTIGKYTPVTLH